MNIKVISHIISLVLVLGALIPVTSMALSCMPENMMIAEYVESADYVIFTAVAGETIEHVKKPAQEGNINFAYDSGYTGQHVTVTKEYKGKISGDLWIYHHKDSTWGYMCAGGPAEPGVEMLYIIRPPMGLLEVPQVQNSYPADSQLAIDLIVALEAAEDNGPAYINFTTSESWDQNLRDDITEIMFWVRLKLVEWRWWNNQ